MENMLQYEANDEQIQSSKFKAGKEFKAFQNLIFFKEEQNNKREEENFKQAYKND